QKDAPVAPEKKDPEQKDAPVAPEKKAPEQKEAEKPAADAAQEKAARKPSEVLKDPHASAEDKLRAAKDMAKNGENKFTGDDGRQYRISTQKYGDREGVVVSTTDSKGKFMPVLRGLVDKEGKVTQQRDSSGKAVDYAGTKASREIKGDSVLTTGKKADGGSEKKVEPQPEEKKPQQPEEKKPQQPEEKKPQQPEEKKPQPEEKKPPEEKKVEPEQGDKGQGQKPEQKEKPPAEEKGQGNPKPETHDKPADGEKQPQDTKDKPEEKKKGPLGSDFVPVDKPQQKVETIASVYGRPQQTASGRYFRPDEMTAAFNPAHLPKGLNLKDGDVIRVTHDGKSVDVTLTDRGPYIQGRGIDLSTAAGRALGITVEGKGVGKVTFEKIGREPGFKDAPRPKKRK
ncbi:MAG: septal ring lytic transglycosylase RlpA family protein, partial [Candidatus Obscuribacterales bacterium]|nr:septal ring lytic transglycosylase RlpA family protein [Candidatus Obscuribacterales bacterium]